MIYMIVYSIEDCYMSKTTDYLKTIFFVLIALQIAPPLLKNLKKQYIDLFQPHTKIAYVSIKGALYNSDYYTKHLKAFFKDPEIKAILLRIESPGSTAGSAEALANEIDLFKKEFPKPLVVLSENICASGAYYIAACSDYIIASPSTFIGSIGTQIPYQFKLKEFIEQFKIQYQVIKAGDYKTVTDPFSDTTPEQNAYLQELAEDSYRNFVEHVAKHRSGISISQKNEWANGKIFTGTQALSLGLIDSLGSRSTAVKKIKELAMIEGKIEWVEPPKHQSLLGFFSGEDARETESAQSLAHAFSTLRSLVLHSASLLHYIAI